MKLLYQINLIFLTVFCAGCISCTKPVEGEENYSIIFGENPVMAGYDRGSYETSVISEYDWTAVSETEWIKDVSRTEDGIGFEVAQNNSDKFRDGNILFSIKGTSYTKSLTVRQAGNTSGLRVDETELELETGEEEKEIKVSSSEAWTVAPLTEDWLYVEKKNSSTLHIKAETNYSGTKRDAVIVLSTASETARVTVSQKFDNTLFCNASTEAGRRFVYNSKLVTTITEEAFATLANGIDMFRMSYMGNFGGTVSPYSVFFYEVSLNGKTGIAVTCADDDDSSIKSTDAELTKVQIVREQLNAMSTKRKDVKVWGGVNGDFFYGGVGASGAEARNNLLHGVMYRGGKCLKGTFDGGDACMIFAVMKDGTARIMTQSQYAKAKDSVYEAIGGRQHLLSSGNPLEFTDLRLEPRTAVGVSRDGKKVIILVVDGRRDNYSVGASYKLLATMLSSMGAYEAINLDGGGSSTFVLNENGTLTTKNRPTDNAGERSVVNGLAIIENLE